MNRYFIEAHLHTKEVSPCGGVNASELISRYKAAGYSTVIVTDHYREDIYNFANGSNEDKIDHFLSGYNLAKAKGDEIGIQVLLGMEIGFNGHPEDYLVYGITKELLIENPFIFKLTIESFYEYAKSKNLLVIQAHPFRTYLSVTSPEYIDGVEVINANPRHNSFNDKAQRYADNNNLLRTAGSDTHQTEDIALSGMISPYPVNTIQQFINGIKNNEFSIINLDNC